MKKVFTVRMYHDYVVEAESEVEAIDRAEMLYDERSSLPDFEFIISKVAWVVQ